MHVSLLPLLPRDLEFRGNKFVLLKDRNVYDSVDVLTSDTQQNYFVSTQSKKKSQANFTGDYTLVKEANVFLVVQLQFIARDALLADSVWLTFWRKGYFSWKITTPEEVTVDEDRLDHIGGGPRPEIFSTETNNDEVVHSASRYSDRRTYLVGENKVVPGGRAIDFTAYWSESGGNGLAATVNTSVVFGGGEYEPD